MDAVLVENISAIPLLSSAAMMLVSPRDADGGGVGILFCIRADIEEEAAVEAVVMAVETDPLARRGSTSWQSAAAAESPADVVDPY